jgi:hypothetical protein
MSRMTGKTSMIYAILIHGLEENAFLVFFFDLPKGLPQGRESGLPSSLASL